MQGRIGALELEGNQSGCALICCIATPHAHLVVYHVDFHGATSHMGIHVVKVDKLNHDKNHVVIHVVLQRKRNVLENIELNRKSNQIAESVKS